MDLHAQLISINENKDFQQLKDDYKDLFGSVWQNYSTNIFGKHRIKIGEPDKERRRCRFCGRMRPDVKFGNKAHAISEALGNKNMFLYEECDQCNEHLGHGIERDLITFLNFYRSFYGISGKKGKPKIKGTNFTLQQGEKGFEIRCRNVANDPEGNLVSADLQFQEKITFQNVYRALCKYALSVIDDKHLQYFENTIKWIRGEKVQTRLPRVAASVTTSFFELAPNIAIHVRKVSDTNLPHLVGEFHFTALTFVFIVPFSTQDDKSFCNDSEFQRFWKFFKYYDKTGEWIFRDLSDDSERELILHLVLEKRDGPRQGQNI